jgi:hypothetical protein
MASNNEVFEDVSSEEFVEDDIRDIKIYSVKDEDSWSVSEKSDESEISEKSRKSRKDVKNPLRWCDVCGVTVPRSRDNWNMHCSGKRHRMHQENKESGVGRPWDGGTVTVDGGTVTLPLSGGRGKQVPRPLPSAPWARSGGTVGSVGLETGKLSRVGGTVTVDGGTVTVGVGGHEEEWDEFDDELRDLSQKILAAKGRKLDEEADLKKPKRKKIVWDLN